MRLDKRRQAPPALFAAVVACIVLLFVSWHVASAPLNAAEGEAVLDIVDGV
jgi:hypothetical protein